MRKKEGHFPAAVKKRKTKKERKETLRICSIPGRERKRTFPSEKKGETKFQEKKEGRERRRCDLGEGEEQPHCRKEGGLL